MIICHFPPLVRQRRPTGCLQQNISSSVSACRARFQLLTSLNTSKSEPDRKNAMRLLEEVIRFLDCFTYESPCDIDADDEADTGRSNTVYEIQEDAKLVADCEQMKSKITYLSQLPLDLGGRSSVPSSCISSTCADISRKRISLIKQDYSHRSYFTFSIMNFYICISDSLVVSPKSLFLLSGVPRYRFCQCHNMESSKLTGLALL